MNALRPIQHYETTLDHSHKTEMENTTPLASSFGLLQSNQEKVGAELVGPRSYKKELTKTYIEAALPHPSAKGEDPLDSFLALTTTSEPGY